MQFHLASGLPACMIFQAPGKLPCDTPLFLQSSAVESNIDETSVPCLPSRCRGQTCGIASTRASSRKTCNHCCTTKCRGPCHQKLGIGLMAPCQTEVEGHVCTKCRGCCCLCHGRAPALVVLPCAWFEGIFCIHHGDEPEQHCQLHSLQSLSDFQRGKA